MAHGVIVSGFESLAMRFYIGRTVLLDLARLVPYQVSGVSTTLLCLLIASFFNMDDLILDMQTSAVEVVGFEKSPPKSAAGTHRLPASSSRTDVILGVSVFVRAKESSLHELPNIPSHRRCLMLAVELFQSILQ